MDDQMMTRPLPLGSIRLTDGFWKEKADLVRREVIPYQWATISDQVEGAVKSYCIHNFRAAARQVKKRGPAELCQSSGGGKRCPEDEVPAGQQVFERWPEDPAHPDRDTFYGFPFQDTDCYKWIEACAYCYASSPDEKLKEHVESVISLVSSAREADGYLDTFYTLTDIRKRFTDLRSFHELYCFGHLTEAAAAWYEASGSESLLDCARGFADCIIAHIGPEEGRLHGVPGHEIAEMALARLYEVTNVKKYHDLGRYFLDQRGTEPNFFRLESERNHTFNSSVRVDSLDGKTGEFIPYSYQQAHMPVAQQSEAVGHAVRAVYLYSGMADYARMDKDKALKDACRRLWENITRRKMYVTGGLGGTHIGEAFSFEYDLPNDTAYAETCASVGMAFFARRMSQLEPDSEYADVLEREMYNGILSGISLDGKHFFYVNPLDVWPLADRSDQRKSHVFSSRRKWLGCACCPPNLARFVSSIGQYAYTGNEESFYVHQYISSEADFCLGGKKLVMKVESGFPYSGKVRVTLDGDPSAEGKIAFRIPGWCRQPVLPLKADGCSITLSHGYFELTGRPAGLSLSFDFPMEAVFLKADERVREDIGMVALLRGPLVYCTEEADMGPDLHLIRIDPGKPVRCEEGKVLDEKVVLLEAQGSRILPDEDGGLYRIYSKPKIRKATVRMIPYYTWANRMDNEMKVWIPEAES